MSMHVLEQCHDNTSTLNLILKLPRCKASHKIQMLDIFLHDQQMLVFELRIHLLQPVSALVLTQMIRVGPST